jgi:hypothetical protein
MKLSGKGIGFPMQVPRNLRTLPADNCPAISAADAVSSVARLVEKLREQVAQLDGRARLAIRIKRHGAIAFSSP